MAAPQRIEYVSFSHSSLTLMCGSKAIDCYDWAGLFEVGASRGSNRAIPGVAGSSVRPHIRGELTAELHFRCRGAFSDNNVVQPVSTHRANVLARIEEVRAFLDLAPGRQLSLTLATSSGSATEPVTFLAMGSVAFKSPEIAEFRVLVAVPSGLFPIPAV